MLHAGMRDNKNMVQPVYNLPVHSKTDTTHVILNLIITESRIAILDDLCHKKLRAIEVRIRNKVCKCMVCAQACFNSKHGKYQI